MAKILIVGSGQFGKSAKTALILAYLEAQGHEVVHCDRREPERRVIVPIDKTLLQDARSCRRDNKRRRGQRAGTTFDVGPPWDGHTSRDVLVRLAYWVGGPDC
jgi:CO dehydrogenase nickel-insertion accessory protein CooC1